MFIYNFKINGSKIFKSIFIFMLLILIAIIGVVIFKIIDGSKNSSNNSMCMSQSNINQIASKNYTNVLKAVHDAPDNYVGMKIKFSGYVYRVLDLDENQFVLARDMIISSDMQSVIVGFLCEFDKASQFSDNTWVELVGTVIKGSYHGDMPIIKVTEIHQTNKPNDEYVYPPDNSYIPTNGIV